MGRRKVSITSNRNDKWSQLRGALKKVLTKGQYDLWIAPLHFLGLQDGTLLLGCRNNFHIQWLRERLEEKIKKVMKTVLPEAHSIQYEIISEDLDDPEDDVEEDARGESEEQNRSNIPRQISFQDLLQLRPSPFNPRFTFDHFVVGECNHLAYASSMAIATGHSFHVSSVYLLSDSGLGKSHLSHAVGNYVIRRNPRLRVRYVTAEQFANEMIAAIKKDKMDIFKRKYREDCDILLLERVEFLGGKQKIQSELIYTIDELLDRGKKIVCTGTKLPRDIPGLHEELRSRLSGVLLAPIDHPDFETRLKILQKKAALERVNIPPRVLEYLAGTIEGDVRKLESCLVGLVAKSNILNTPIDLSLARDVAMTVLDRLPKVNISLIQDLVCEAFRISKEDLVSPSRKKNVALARKIAFYLCREYTKETYQSIGEAFCRNHSTVIYGVKSVQQALDSGKHGTIQKHVDFLSRKLKTRCALGPF